MHCMSLGSIFTVLGSFLRKYETLLTVYKTGAILFYLKRERKKEKKSIEN